VEQPYHIRVDTRTRSKRPPARWYFQMIYHRLKVAVQELEDFKVMQSDALTKSSLIGEYPEVRQLELGNSRSIP
jgi:hypothetical protein